MKSLLGNNKFKFILTGSRFKDNEFEPTIVGVTLPGVMMGVIPQPNMVRRVERPGDSLEYDDLRINFSLREDMSDWLTIYNWLTDMRDHKDAKFKEIFSDANLVLLTNKNNPNLVFNFEGVFPISLDQIDFTTDNNDSPMLCSANFKFISFKILTNI